MYDGREIFHHAPLVYVTAEVRLSYEPGLAEREALDRFAALIRDWGPILETQTMDGDSFVGPDGEERPQRFPVLRAFSEDRRSSVGLTPGSLTLETVSYETFAQFKGPLDSAVEALVAVAPRVYVQRAGLRFVNEVRVPNVSTSRDWSGWINSNYICALEAMPDAEAVALSGAMVTKRGDDDEVLFRWGEVEGPTVISADSRLIVDRPEPSRFFVLDIDSSWEPDLEVPLQQAALARRFAELHDPIGSMFMSALTPRLKQLFRGDDSDVGGHGEDG